ncbi:HAD family acid phosphatase [Saccharothrix obliqua]|uniref:HAD family acid phosphatase n=1 Tax=Saccharothrix obliqua TaxID=2861747 RepID=UPI001C5E6AC7|nr:HAD family acid phosphatase [Saccharothrix obliqua]MBW4718770.1 HAD family acid phosphatase [Saccharothrix obliqua]
MSRSGRWTGFVVAVSVGLTLAGGAVGLAGPGSTATAAEPPNLGRAKAAVKEYYGGHVVDGRNQHSEDSQWGRDTGAKVREAREALLDRVEPAAGRAIVLDVDDTAEITYGWAADRDFGFDRGAQHEAIRAGVFPPIRPVRELAWDAHRLGIKVFFITGRPESLREPTARHLAEKGFPPAELFLKPDRAEDAPPYLPCADKCRTGVYKTLTREHLQEARGHTIVVNVGDQESDFEGGFSRHDIKLPNPMYHVR